MDQRASRTDKLLSLTQNELLSMVRRWLFFENEHGNRSTVHLEKVLKYVSGNEGEWLRKTFENVPDFSHYKMLGYIYRAIGNDNSPCALYYRARASHNIFFLVDDYLRALRQSAEAGFAPAMVRLGFELEGEERAFWIQNGAELGDPDALFALSKYSEAAERGSIEAMREINELIVRATLLTGYGGAYSACCQAFWSRA